eukprot:jgi/Ulvmu1/5019/UM021_0036.1
MEGKMKALSTEERHTFSKIIKKLACVARKVDDAVFGPADCGKKRAVTDKAPTAADTEAGAPAEAGGELEPERLLPRLRPQVKLGILRLDYNYEAAPGDIDYPMSFKYKVIYRVVPGLTFEMCQSGKLTAAVDRAFREAIRWLDEEQNVDAITGDCGFMFWFQDMARRQTSKPVLLSSLVQLPAITCGFAKHKKIAIFTANGHELMPMCELINKECGVNIEDSRFHIVGCEDVPGFDAVAQGRKVDVGRVQPGIIELARHVTTQDLNVRAILLECTELPPYADALRRYLNIPVYDAVTCADMFMDGLQDNPRFGDMDWREPFDGNDGEYEFGGELEEGELEHCINCIRKMDAQEKAQQLTA